MELYPDGKVGKEISWIDVVNRLGTDANGRTAKQVRERWHNSYVYNMLVIYHAAAVVFVDILCDHAIISQQRHLNIFYLCLRIFALQTPPRSQEEGCALVREGDCVPHPAAG